MYESTLDGVIQYANDCIDSKINCCQKHKWACQRFLRDYEATQQPDSKYEYYWGEVERVIKWAALFQHTKGVLTGKPIELHISQVFLIANIYGFYNRETGYRRFKKFYFQLARKNAKSQLLSVILTYELMVFLDGGLAEVYCAATKKDQAKIVYNEMLAMLRKCKSLKGKWKEAYRQLVHIKSGSFCKPLSKEDEKTGDGLNPQCACIDEYHAHQNSDVYDVIDSGMGARQEPLLGIITTAGFELNNPCYTVEYELMKRILDPEDEADLETVFCDIHELEVNTGSEEIELPDGRKVAPGDMIDDPFDEKNWVKANPIICSYDEGIGYIREKAKEAKLSPDKMRNFLTKHLNVWVNQREAGYMNLAKWNACGGEIPDLSGETCFVGLDLSSRNDLTSAGIVFPLSSGKYVVIGRSFIPESTFHEQVKKVNVRYDLWEKQGWLTVTPGEVVDYRVVTQWVKDKVEELGAYIEEWCVDPWGATQVSNDLIEEGHEVVDIVQGIKTLSEPTKEFRNEVAQKNIIHEKNPLISWAIGNAIVDIVDKNMNIILNKKKSKQKIDPIASVMNGFVRAMVADANAGYNKRSMRSL